MYHNSGFYMDSMVCISYMLFTHKWQSIMNHLFRVQLNFNLNFLFSLLDHLRPFDWFLFRMGLYLYGNWLVSCLSLFLLIIPVFKPCFSTFLTCFLFPQIKILCLKSRHSLSLRPRQPYLLKQYLLYLHQVWAQRNFSHSFKVLILSMNVEPIDLSL